MAKFNLADFIDSRIGIRMKSTGGHGDELVCNCPFCDGKDKFYVNPKRGRFICYKCDARGDTVKLVMDVDGLARRDALQFIYDEATRLPSKSVAELVSAGEDHEPEDAAARVVALPPNFEPVFDGETWRVPDYLRERRIQARVAAAYGLGACLRRCGRDCRSESSTRRPCDACRYINRLILPAHVHGELAFFQARSMTGAEPKYLAPVSTRADVLYGFDEAAGATKVAFVEGPVDVLGCAQAHIPAYGLMGKVCSLEQAILAASAGVTHAVVMLDPEARREGAITAMTLGNVIDRVEMALLPAGKDPGNAGRELLHAAWASARAPTLRDRLR